MNKEENNPDIDVENIIVGPGKSLSQAREKLGLSVEDVAKKLNFRVTLVNDIDADIFDASLPKTFNRGYLTNYARLVGLPPAEILLQFEQLMGENTKHSVMQSFSRNTEKQAESNIIMWISYGIIALLVGSTVMWWLQDINKVEGNPTVTLTENVKDGEEKAELQSSPEAENVTDVIIDNAQTQTDGTEENDEFLPEDYDLNNSTSLNQERSIDYLSQEDTTLINSENAIADVEQPSNLTRAIFTFSGDCWVNIYDGNDERIAWGIKKAGYVMELNAFPPLKVTVGKPELVAINVNGFDVDLSTHSVGNIAKFTLPKS